MVNRIAVNLKEIFKWSSFFTGGLYSILGFIGTWAPIDECILKEKTLGCRIFVSILILLLIWMFAIIVTAVVLCRCKKIEIFQTSQGHHLYVQYGDLFDSNIVNHPEKRRNLLIAVNRCFDTLVDDDLIRYDSIHGQAIKRICGTGRYSLDALNIQLRRQLIGYKNNAKKIEKHQKKKGNLLRYQPGTIVEIELSDIETYFLVGFAWLDEDLHAQYSAEDYQITMIRILNYCQKRSQGYPLVIPLIGSTTASGTGYVKSDILQYMIYFFKLNEKLINCDIHIVVNKDDKNCVSIL